jgi:hypothetical protein
VAGGQPSLQFTVGRQSSMRGRGRWAAQQKYERQYVTKYETQSTQSTVCIQLAGGQSAKPARSPRCSAPAARAAAAAAKRFQLQRSKHDSKCLQPLDMQAAHQAGSKAVSALYLRAPVQPHALTVRLSMTVYSERRSMRLCGMRWLKHLVCPFQWSGTSGASESSSRNLHVLLPAVMPSMP